MKEIKNKYILGLVLFIGIAGIIEGQEKPRKYVYPLRPEEKIETEVNQVYYELVKDSSNIDWNRLDGTLKYVRAEYDCSDFRLVNLLRILYEYRDRIPDDYLEKVEDVLFNFRYWWDEPGENSMCYWSENHQILFASAEYLVGQLYSEQIFPSSGLSGKEHSRKARIRIQDWLEMRWYYGYIEYYSSVYYKEDIGGLINLIDFAEDEELVKKCQMILDLLFYDVASQNINTMFTSVSGRAYKRNRIGVEAGNFNGLTDYYWGDGKEIGPGIMYGLMVSKKYQPPPVIKEIARDENTVIIKQCNGLDLTELKTEGYYGTDNRSMMMQWGMEAFTNPIIVRNSIQHIRNTNMFSNAFLSDFRTMNFFLFRWLHLEPTLMRILNPQQNGVAIQKGNTYTYKTKDYSMYTVQSHQVGDFADQQHVFGMNIGNHFAIFHTHPARERNVNADSPNYWVGYGHFPHSVQDKNVNLSIYNIPRKKGIMEAELLEYTRAYFPEALFDTSFISGSYAFGKKGESYSVLIGSGDFGYRDEARDDLILKGKKAFWITEAGSRSEDGSFEAFTNRILDNELHFDEKNLELKYLSMGNQYELKFGEDFLLNKIVVTTDYPRYDSPYAREDKKPETITFEHEGHSLFLDFGKQIREIR